MLFPFFPYLLIFFFSLAHFKNFPGSFIKNLAVEMDLEREGFGLALWSYSLSSAWGERSTIRDAGRAAETRAAAPFDKWLRAPAHCMRPCKVQGEKFGGGKNCVFFSPLFFLKVRRGQGMKGLLRMLF